MEFDTNFLMIAGLFAFAGGGLAYVFIYPMFSGENRAEKRQQTLKMASARARQGLGARTDAVTRRKQVESTLKDIANKQEKKKTQTLEDRFGRAGLDWDRQKFFMYSGILALVVTAVLFMLTSNLLIALPGLLVGGVGLPRWILGFLGKRRVNRFVNEFPNALDIIVRGIKSGLPLGDCLRIIAAEAADPVRTEFRKIVESQTLGLTVPEAIERMVERIPVTEANFFSIVISIQAKAGGNLSEALSNLSKVLRERKKMKGKVQAMAAEAKASGFIIGGLPFAVATLVYMSSPDYISLLWTTDMGKIALLIAGTWMSIGIMSMKKMINFDM